jgi:hypothetical protein
MTLEHLKDKIEKVIDEIEIKKVEIPSFNKLEKRIIWILGWVIFIACLYYWIFFFFIARFYEPLLYTTYFTLILISFTCIFKFESPLFNTLTCITVYGFINITVGLFFEVTDILNLISGGLLHAFIAGVQLFIIFHPKIYIQRGYLMWGLLFYFIFMSSYDSFHRWNLITGLENVISDTFTKAYSFYALWISGIVIYFYKNRHGLVIKE